MGRGAVNLIPAILLAGFLAGPPFGPSRGAAFGIACDVARAEQKTAAQLEAEFERESNPKKRVKLAVELTDERLKGMLAAYETEDPSKESEAAGIYLASLDRLEKALGGVSDNGVSKDTEIHLRRQARSLANLRLNVSYTEASVVEKALQRTTQLHEGVLYSIMRLKKDRK
jgi:hypothetical protein